VLRERAEKDIWAAILDYAHKNISTPVVESMQKTFVDNKTEHDVFLSRMFGVLDQDERGSALDRVLGDMMISLHQLIQGYDNSVEQLNELIHFASTMQKTMPRLGLRMNHLLLNSKFAKKLDHLICTLAFPERACNTFVKAAQTCRCLGQVIFHLQSDMSPPKRTRSAAPVPISTTVTPLPTRNAEAHSYSAFSSSSPPKISTKTSIKIPTKTTSTGTPSQRSPKRPTPPPLPHKAPPKSQQSDSSTPSMSDLKAQFGMTDILRQYLSEDDLLHGPAQLEPSSKKHTAELIIHLLCGQLPPPISHAWYTFAFVATGNNDERAHLAGLYQIMLKEAPDKKDIFREIEHAVKTNTLVDLFEAKGYGHIRDLCPYLEAFLTTPPSRRASAFRLIQFIHNESTEPPAVLRRDYGFKYCKQREEVQRLKVIYTKVIDASDLKALHNACIHGRLHEFAVQQGVCIDAKYRRLMQNDYPNPCTGYDDDAGLAAYSKPLFKTSA
jgi:hypothetical protein